MPHIRERSCSIFPVHLGARRCHSDPLMTDGLANEIQFGFECDARPSEKNRLAGCEIGSVPPVRRSLSLNQRVQLPCGSAPNRSEPRRNRRTERTSARGQPFGLPSSPWPCSVTETRCSAENARSIFILGLSNRHRRELFSSVALTVTR